MDDRLTRDPRPVSSFTTIRRYDDAPTGSLTPPEQDDRDWLECEDGINEAEWDRRMLEDPRCTDCGAILGVTRHAPTCYFHPGNSRGGR